MIFKFETLRLARANVNVRDEILKSYSSELHLKLRGNWMKGERNFFAFHTATERCGGNKKNPWKVYIEVNI